MRLSFLAGSHKAKRCAARAVLAVMLLLTPQGIAAQDDGDDIFKSLNLSEVSLKKAKSHAVRLYAYYRYWDDGVSRGGDREFKLFKAYEGICSIDIRYGKDADDGSDIIVARNLVHPDQPGMFMEFFELKPYTFLEKARRTPKDFTIEEKGDTTRVYANGRLDGTVVRDTLRRELRMRYNALSPDTTLSLNLLILKARLNGVDAQAVYHLDDADAAYVPQGNLKCITFEGDIVLTSPIRANIEGDGPMRLKGEPLRQDYHEYTEIYVDSVAYMTRDEYRADKKLSARERRQRAGYTEGDIDRLKQKHHVAPLSDRQQQLIEEQRDWDEAYELWRQSLNKK